MPRQAARLTNTYIQSLAPSNKPRDVSDPAVRGLLIRIWPWGTKNWLFRYSWEKAQVRLSLGNFPERSIHDAHELALEYRALLTRGIDPRASDRATAIGKQGIKQSAATDKGNKPLEEIGSQQGEFDQLLDAQQIELDPHSFKLLAREFYRLYILPNRQDPAYVRRVLTAEILPVRKDRDARTIKPREVIKLLDNVVGRGAKVMANRIASIMTQMFVHGIHRDTIEDSPVKLLGRPGGKEKSRTRALRPDELAPFVQNIDSACRSRRKARLLMVLLLTGKRRKELGLAKWKDIDFVHKRWRIPPEHSKNGFEDLVPLTDWAVRELEVLKRMAGRSRFVCPSTKPDRPANPRLITRSVARCLPRFKKIGVDPFTPHDLRRTCRTLMARLKVDPVVAKKVLNHRAKKLDETYDVFEYFEEKRMALELVERHLLRLLQVTEPGTEVCHKQTSGSAGLSTQQGE